MKNKNVVIVTGASRGIGFECAKYFLKNNYIVYCCARNIKDMKPLEDLGGIVVHLDVSKKSSIKDLFAKMKKNNHILDCLINNAGFGIRGPFECIDIEDGKKLFEVNLFGAALMMQDSIKIFKKHNKNGCVINVSSVVGKFSTPYSGWYTASKHALLSLSESVRMELGNKKIKIIVFEPGLIKTNFSNYSKNLKLNLDKTNIKDYTSFTKMNNDSADIMAKKGSDPIIVAKKIFSIVNKNKRGYRYHAGAYSNTALFFRKLLSDKLFYKFFIES